MNSDKLPVIRRKIKQSQVQPQKQTNRSTALRWSEEDKLAMASYLSGNYNSFKSLGQNGGRKMDFLRKMKEHLKITCDDKQIKNGFDRLLSKYKEIREKLNSSGFGVDPEKDKSLDKGWVLKQCPYFDILDAVMGTKPNIVPPFILTTEEFGAIGFENFEEEIPCDQDIGDKLDDDFQEDEQDSVKDDDIESCKDKDSELKEMVKSQFEGLGIKRKKEKLPKNALNVFAQIMEKNMDGVKEVEEKKLRLENDKFQYSQKMDESKKEIELAKISADKEIRLKELQEREKQRAYEETKLKADHEFELEKLRLQIELEKARNRNC